MKDKDETAAAGASTKPAISSSVEDYLEAFLRFEANGRVKSVDIAKALGVSKAAVSIASKEFVSQGLIEKKSYGEITLTPEGRKIAEEVFKRHNLIKRLLLGIGVPEATAEVECCKIEHVLSRETLKSIQKVVDSHGF